MVTPPSVNSSKASWVTSLLTGPKVPIYSGKKWSDAPRYGLNTLAFHISSYSGAPYIATPATSTDGTKIRRIEVSRVFRERPRARNLQRKVRKVLLSPGHHVARQPPRFGPSWGCTVVLEKGRFWSSGPSRSKFQFEP